jgi:hemoglobin-like flavoprotein
VLLAYLCEIFNQQQQQQQQQLLFFSVVLFSFAKERAQKPPIDSLMK